MKYEIYAMTSVLLGNDSFVFGYVPCCTAFNNVFFLFILKAMD